MRTQSKTLGLDTLTGLSWREIDSVVKADARGTIFDTAPADGEVCAVGDGALTDKYRPRKLSQLWGQPEVVQALTGFTRKPHAQAFLFCGETGTGKTSAAICLASALGCAVEKEDWGGLSEIVSGEQNAETVRGTARRLYMRPWSGSGWTVLVVNEADKMTSGAETVWLDLLEHLPKMAVVVFSTNDPHKLSQRFRDRCATLIFRSGAATLSDVARKLCGAIWTAETGATAPETVLEDCLELAVVDGKVSLRRAVTALGMELEKVA